MAEPYINIDFLKPVIIEAAATLLGTQQIMQKEVRQKSLDAYKRLTEAHLLSTGAIGSALARFNGKRSSSKQTATDHDRNALVASFVIGLDIVEQTITGGYYLQAAALLRQELETLAALAEIDLGTRQEGRVPNIRSIEQVKHLYGDLSAAAHVANRTILTLTTSLPKSPKATPTDTTVTRYFPAFDESIARCLYSTHILMMLLLAKQLDANLQHSHREGMTALEQNCLQAALRILLEEKCIDLVSAI